MTDTDNSYVPVSCALHSELELAIMHRSLLHLVWTDENNNQHHFRLIPVDIETSNRQEFLIAHDENGRQYTIRLDQISSFNNPS